MIRKRSLTFKDQLKLTDRPKLFSDTPNLVEDIFSAGGNANRVALRTRIRATHSGYLLNSRVYPGVFMERSVGSWIVPERGGSASYDKPVILNHDQTDATQTIGRVRGASFVRLKEGNEFAHDFKRPASGRDHGSGHINLDAVITDPDSIAKILDGRYDTVSTGQRPSEARCNICGFDWLSHDPWDQDSQEPCDHRPGKMYQIDKSDIPCYLITGDLDYREVSYVTVPAQPNARTLNANLESLQTFASKDSEDRELFFHSFDDSGGLSCVDLFDMDGHKLNLILGEAEDVLPDDVTRFMKTAVFFPDTKDNDMPKDKKLTTNEADDVLDSWISDASKRTAEASGSEQKDDAVTEKDQNKPVENKNANNESQEFTDLVSKISLGDFDKDKLAEGEDDVTNDARVSDEAIKEIIDTVRAERNSLKDEKTSLENQLSEKAELVDTLASQIADLRKGQVTDAARTLTLIRSIVGQKKDVLDDKDSFNTYVDELSQRSIESLSDAISDSLPELQSSLKNMRRNNTQVLGKVDNPTLQHKDTDRDNQGENDGESKTKELMDKDDYLAQL